MSCKYKTFSWTKPVVNLKLFNAYHLNLNSQKAEQNIYNVYCEIQLLLNTFTKFSPQVDAIWTSFTLKTLWKKEMLNNSDLVLVDSLYAKKITRYLVL